MVRVGILEGAGENVGSHDVRVRAQQPADFADGSCCVSWLTRCKREAIGVRIQSILVSTKAWKKGNLYCTRQGYRTLSAVSNACCYIRVVARR